MQSSALRLWQLRFATFALAGLAAASMTYWALQWAALSATDEPLPESPSNADVADPQVVARFLGSGQRAVATPGATTAAAGMPLADTSHQFKLTGVVADRAKGGYAVISVDGKPARSYRVGARVTETLVLHSLERGRAFLAASAAGPIIVTLEVPPLKKP